MNRTTPHPSRGIIYLAFALVAAMIVAALLIAMSRPAHAWHGALQASVECVNHQSVATWTLTEPGEQWNTGHVDMIVTQSNHPEIVALLVHVPFAGTYETNPVAIDAPVTVDLTVRWDLSQEHAFVTATAVPISDCVPPTTTTSTTEPPTSTTTVPESTTTTASPPAPTSLVTTTTAPDSPPAAVVVEPSFTG